MITDQKVAPGTFPPSSPWLFLWGTRDYHQRDRLLSLVGRYWNPVYAYLETVQPGEHVKAADQAREFLTLLVRDRSDSFFLSDQTSLRGFIKRSLLTFTKEHGLPAGSDHQFDDHWNRTLLASCLMELETILKQKGREEWTHVMRSHCFPEGTSLMNFSAVAGKHQISELKVRTWLWWCRQDFRALLKNKIRVYVSEDRDIADELSEILKTQGEEDILFHVKRFLQRRWFEEEDYFEQVDERIGRIALEKKWLLPEELEFCRLEQAEAIGRDNAPQRLDQILLSRRMLTHQQIGEALLGESPTPELTGKKALKSFLNRVLAKKI